MTRLLALLFLLLPLSAAADVCTVRVHGMDITIDAEQFTDDDLTVSTGEQLMTAPKQMWANLRGTLPPCSSNTTLTFMGSLMETYTPNGYCLEYGDNDAGYLLLPGSRNFRGRCERTTCERVNAAADEVSAINTQMRSIFGRPPSFEEIARTETLGAMAIKGSDRLLRGQLNNIATTAIFTALGAPEILAASTVTVVALQGAAFLCHD
ncbi:hypothetical protein BVC71_12190 [Marivivens niveibacter]|uniref:Nuclease n=1 Tax=Marivivens niveibacter TaxID=1930667 RepID=A0A251WX89_9RHOB|nr:hypothetical protein [Marivivens niveibacter]OUD08684.1 hypothetical protein BVC71_12190 [Marivivens niveibacter]